MAHPGLRCLALALGLWLGGCASTPPTPIAWQHLPGSVLIAGVPFYPQETDQCGPAALASVLVFSGVETSPGQLREQVFLPRRGGSLGLELIGATRRAGRLPYRLAPEPADLLRELAAGHPVLVLQNLGFPIWPQWHFAVAVGYEREDQHIILHSGTEAHYRVDAELFMRTWQRADYWAVVVPPPGRRPATARAPAYLRAANALEQVGQTEAAHRAYQLAVEQWPGEAAAVMGKANTAYQMGRHRLATETFLQLLSQRPTYSAAWNNIAYSLLADDCPSAAYRAACCAVALADRPAYRDTLKTIRSSAVSPSRAGGESLPHCRTPPCPAPVQDTQCRH